MFKDTWTWRRLLGTAEIFSNLEMAFWEQLVDCRDSFCIRINHCRFGWCTSDCDINLHIFTAVFVVFQAIKKLCNVTKIDFFFKQSLIIVEFF